jgi:uncharacterized protein YkwD
MKRFYILIIIIAAFSMVVVTPGCSKKHSSSRSSAPSNSTATGSGTGTGTGGTATGDTVPGNIDLGLAASPEAPRIAGGTADEQMIADMVNDFRAENGLSPFAWNDGIADCERSHAYDCEQQNYFGHGAKAAPDDYSICNARAQSLGFSGGVLECACWDTALSSVVQAWINSPGHRNALLNSGNTRHGVGISAKNKYIMHASQ